MISGKQLEILAFGHTDYDALICDGAVRSGKTSLATVAFVSWAMREFDGRAFIVGGVSSGSARRNVIDPFMALAWAKRHFSMRWNGQDNCMTVSNGENENRFYVFGGKDEASFRMVQGMTAAGCLLDECALMPRSFVEQCLSRCSVDGSKYWFSCNPSGPEHWFYREWILCHEQKNAYYLHFTLDDNPSLSERIRERYRSMYSGVFYRRYVLGEWVKAEGLVYDLPEGALCECEATKRDVCYLSIDYGISNPFAALLWVVRDGVGYCVDEYYHDGREEGKRTDEEHYQAVERLVNGRFVDAMVVDPSATSFIELVRRKGVFDVRKANNDVLGGIMSVSSALAAGCLKFSPRCANMRREFGLYSWDPKAKGDRVIKEHDHACVVGSTLIQTEDGLKPISSLVGTSGMAWTLENGRKVLKSFHDCAMTRENAEIWEIETERGIIRCTGDHRVMTERGKVAAKDLTESDRVVTDGGAAAIIRTRRTGCREDVYNMTVDDAHIYLDENGHALCNCDAMRYFTHTVGRRLLKCFDD